MKFVLAACLSVLLVAGCSESPNTESPNMENDQAKEEAPTHNYRVKEGANYGYVGGISDEERKSGKTAAELHLFRYVGEKDGVHTVQQVEEDGTVLLTATCTDPCEFMKLKIGDAVERIEYNPESLGGAVMQDAITGQLEVAN
jgi:hypothetical protein